MMQEIRWSFTNGVTITKTFGASIVSSMSMSDRSGTLLEITDREDVLSKRLRYCIYS